MLYLTVIFTVLLIALIYVSASRKSMKREMVIHQQLDNLSNRIAIVSDQFDQLEKRLTNVEMIVTDSKFEEGSGKEAINLRTELTELKKIIQDIKK